MQGIDERTFSYRPWRPWFRILGVVFLGAFLYFITLWARPPSLAQVISQWLLAAFLATGIMLAVYFSVRGFTDPHTITVTRQGIIGRPICGPAVELDWEQVASVQQIKSKYLGRPEVTRIRAVDGRRTIVFNEELPGYHELTRIVLEQMRAREE